jgi:hypothetical protein
VFEEGDVIPRNTYLFVALARSQAPIVLGKLPSNDALHPIISARYS